MGAFIMKRSIVAKNITTGEVFIFESAREAKKKGFDESHIIKCCRGRRKKHKGYTWSYYLPVKTLKEAVYERSWSLQEDEILKNSFPSGNLEELMDKFKGRSFKDILCRAEMLGLKRKQPHVKNISPYDLIHDLASDVVFNKEH